MAGSSKKAIYAALVGNSLIAVTKFAAAAYTGSSAMFSEGIHSLVDTGNQGLLLYGMKRAKRPPSSEFPFGHGKEIYFWSFIVAMLIFAFGGAISIYQGWQHLFRSEPMGNVSINYLVLGLAIVFETGALWVALKEFNLSRADKPLLQAIRGGKDPTLFVVVFEDSAALLGLLIALVGIGLYQVTGNPIWDAIASICIGGVLIFTAWFLAVESKNLLIGESAEVEIEKAILALMDADDRVNHVNEVATLHMGPDFIVVALSVDFIDKIGADGIQTAVTQLNRQLKAIDLRIKRVFIEAEDNTNHLASSQAAS